MEIKNLKNRFQELAGIKPIKEGNFDSRFKDAMGDAGFSDEEQEDIMSRDVDNPFLDDDDITPGAELASRTIEKLRQQYRGISDQDMDDFSKEMVLHFLDNTAAQAAAKIFFGKRNL
tara:strand:- start:607 stop:957 length:351 start_codon:yes stop_codon:yes gene_type:complete